MRGKSQNDGNAFVVFGKQSSLAHHVTTMVTIQYVRFQKILHSAQMSPLSLYETMKIFENADTSSNVDILLNKSILTPFVGT